MEEIGLFPLGIVLLPSERIPLHIFEDRYRELVRHCIDTTSPFGIVLIREGREVGTGAISFTGIGTIAEIRDAGRYEEAYSLFAEGLRVYPGHPGLLYNLACAEARGGRADEAVAHLREAIAGDERYSGRAREDPDFDSIRGTPGFPA